MSAAAALAAAARGDLEAYRRFIAACEPAVRAVVAATMPMRSLVDEGVSEILVAAHDRLRELIGGGDPTARITAFAGELALARRRAWLRQEQSRRGYRAEVETALEDEVAPRAARAVETLAALGGCLGRLEAQARAVIEEHCWRGESPAAIAKARDRSDAWVRVVLFRAHAALADCLRAPAAGTAAPLPAPTDAERLDYLLSAWIAEGLTDAEGRELADRARREPALRARLADLALVHRLLPEAGPAPARATADAVIARIRSTGAAARAETVTEEDRPVGVRASRMTETQRPPRPLWPWALLVAVLAVATGGVLLWKSHPPEVRPPPAPAVPDR